MEMSRRLEGKLNPIAPPRPLSGMRGHLWEQSYLPLAAGRSVLWSPCTTGPLAHTRQVCTIHDVLPLDHPEWFSPRFAAWYSWLLPRLAKRVRHIATVSEFSRGRIVERLGVPPERVTTVPNGVDARFRPQSPEEVQAALETLRWPRRYFLAVGIEPRKNAPAIIEAWSRVVDRMPDDVYLVLAGAEMPTLIHGDTETIPTLPARVRVPGYVHENYLPAAYCGAQALVFASLYEGFGLPVLEAMSCGTPVIASDRTAVPEVLGGAGLTVNPDDAEAIGQAMLALAENDSLRAQCREKGLERARAFSWDQSAASMWEILEREAAA